MSSALPVDLHSHSVASGHAFGTILEMARAAQECGLSILGVTDHGPSMEGVGPVGAFEMVDRIPHVVEGIRLLMGCEANILNRDGLIDLPQSIASGQDLLLAGLHARTPYPSDSTIADNTHAIVAALRNPHVHIISHPVNPIFKTDIGAIAKAASQCGKLLEVNLSTFRRLSKRNLLSPDEWSVFQTREMLRVLKENGGRFIINSDAHTVWELGCGNAEIDSLAELLGCDLGDAINYDMATLRQIIPSIDGEL